MTERSSGEVFALQSLNDALHMAVWHDSLTYLYVDTRNDQTEVNDMATLQAQAQAFKQGLADRLQGKPMIAHDDGNDSSLVDAYACGYDPHGEQFTSLAVARLTAQLASIAKVIIPSAANLPHNACEFPGMV